jgi:hypothetical protein
MTLEELRRDYGWLGNTLVSAFLGAAAMWAAAWRRMRRVEKKQAAQEIRIDKQTSDILALEAAKRTLESRLQDMGDSINRVEGGLEQLTDLRHEVRGVSSDLHQLMGSVKLFPQLLEATMVQLKSVQDKIETLKQ